MYLRPTGIPPTNESFCWRAGCRSARAAMKNFSIREATRFFRPKRCSTWRAYPKRAAPFMFTGMGSWTSTGSSPSARLADIPKRPEPARLKIQRIDILFIDRQRSAQNDLAATNFERSQPARPQRSGPAGNLILQQQRTRINCQIAQIPGVPQKDRLHRTIVDVRLANAGKRQADYLDIGASSLPHRLARAGNCRGGNCHYQLYFRENTHDGLRFGERFVPIVIAGAHRSYFQTRIFFLHALADEGNPLVLVSGTERTGNDSELALTVEQARSLVGQGEADALRGRLVDEVIACIRSEERRVGKECR